MQSDAKGSFSFASNDAFLNDPFASLFKDAADEAFADAGYASNLPVAGAESMYFLQNGRLLWLGVGLNVLDVLHTAVKMYEIAYYFIAQPEWRLVVDIKNPLSLGHRLIDQLFQRLQGNSGQYLADGA